MSWQVSSNRWLQILAVAVCVGPWFSGCQSTEMDQPLSAASASATIGGVSEAAIRSELAQVFAAAEYQARPTPEGFVFEQEGSRSDVLTYGAGQPVRLRAVVQVVPLGTARYRLQCTPCVVRAPGTQREREFRLPWYRSRPYQALLDKVVGNLKMAPVGTHHDSSGATR